MECQFSKWEPLQKEKEDVKQEFGWWWTNGMDSLEGKSAAITFPGGLKTGLLERRAADQQELVGRVHELQLL